MMKPVLPAEFERQSSVLLIFPHANSDWVPYLQEASSTFVNIIETITHFEQCIVVCDDIVRVKSYFTNYDNITFIEAQSDDTWARDCSAITLVSPKTKPTLLDFTFNGWGNKFDAKKDNALTYTLANNFIAHYQKVDIVLEGGAIESNGQGLLLTTTACLMNPNRNPHLKEKKDVEEMLEKRLGIQKTLWLDHGYLSGDDTDSHIDTLARFVDANTITYVQCDDPKDEHYAALQAMEQDLLALRDADDQAFTLIPLPMTDAIYYEGERLPATYANFLIINGAVLVPTYNDPHDAETLEILKKTFPARKIIGIDCSVLIRQHGSLHCVTMQFPEQVTLTV